MDFRFKYRRHPDASVTPEVEQREDVLGEETERRVQGLALGLSIPSTLLGSVVAGWLLGSWLDRLLHTSFLIIVFILIGTAAGLTMTVRLLGNLNSK
jgi:F0F1-type ATP synthase assembly protein I